MVEWAKRREWRPLVIQTWTNSQEYRLCLPYEIPVTCERVLIDQPKAVITSFLEEDSLLVKPKIVNNYWLYRLLEHDLRLDNEIIVIDDGSLSFDVEILRSKEEDEVFLKLPHFQKSIKEILKGNRIGKLYHDFDNRYQLRLEWS